MCIARNSITFQQFPQELFRVGTVDDQSPGLPDGLLSDILNHVRDAPSPRQYPYPLALVECYGELVQGPHTACHEDGDAVSGVLGAMGITAERARGAVRLSLGTPTTAAEIERVAKALIAAWQP